MSHADVGRLADRVALVTGGGRGIGRATALALAAEGALVVVNDVDGDPAASTVDEIVRAGGRGLALVASVTDYVTVRRMVAAVLEDLGTIDVLVSNAGIATSGKSIVHTPLEEAEHVMAVNAFAALVLCQEILPAMRAAGRGDIVVISSGAVDHVPPKCGPYTMAKVALEALATTIAKEEVHHGIRANIVAPGMTDTRLGREVLERSNGSTSAGLGLDPAERVAAAVVGLVVDPDRSATGRRRSFA